MPEKRLKQKIAPDKQDVALAVTAQLNHKLMPLDRGKRYEDPLAGI